jgi:hypothetical protein
MVLIDAQASSKKRGIYVSNHCRNTLSFVDFRIRSVSRNYGLHPLFIGSCGNRRAYARPSWQEAPPFRTDLLKTCDSRASSEVFTELSLCRLKGMTA